jgi:hypothetical protein
MCNPVLGAVVGMEKGMYFAVPLLEKMDRKIPKHIRHDLEEEITKENNNSKHEQNLPCEESIST